MVDTVIGLPANLFYSTGIPVCVLVLKKCKHDDDVKREKILRKPLSLRNSRSISLRFL